MRGKNIYSVTQLNEYVRNMFRMDHFLRQLSIQGEVADCVYHQKSGHIYFTLKDQKSSISAVMFKNSRAGLDFQMKNGDQVVVTGQIDVYAQKGRYQVIASKIARQGEGDIYLRFEALKRRLEEMGMFDPMYKKEIPRYATRVGVVTAPGGAAIRDIQSTAFQRNPHVQLILYPALVEGEGASESIGEGIRALDALGLDVIIVGRGGGSEGNLWAFNNEQLARIIFDCRTPVISAVGHEINWTLSDLVADYRVNTPTGAAEKAVFDYEQALRDMEQKRLRLKQLMEQRLAEDRKQLRYLLARLVGLSPEKLLAERKRRLERDEEELRQVMDQILTSKKHRLSLLAERLEACSPARKLSQGYSHVASLEGETITSVGQVTRGQKLRIHVTDGTLTATVEEKKWTNRQ